MEQPIEEPVIHILLVEDVPDTLELMAEYLKKELSGVELHCAETVADALDLLEMAERRRIKFRIAVLDYKLPKSKGEQPEADTKLRDRLRESTSRDAVVFNITAFPTEQKLLQYLNEEQLRNPRSARPLISKLDGDWTERLYEAIRRVVYGDRVAEQLYRLFGSAQVGGRVAARGRLGPSASCDPTHDLAALMRDIEAHWHHLDEKLKDDIRQYFTVKEGPRKVTVSLF